MPYVVTTKRQCPNCSWEGGCGDCFGSQAPSVSRRAVATLEELLVFDSREWEASGYDQPKGNDRFWHPALLLVRYTREDGEELADVLFLHDGRFSRGHIVRAMRDSSTLPESGGTVGPLPDGTVIEVERVTWVYLAMEARRRDASGYRPPPLPVVEAGQGDERAQQAILDAFNARQSA